MPEFSLLTFNCFGGFNPGTRRRLLTLARALNARDDSVVCLQEVQLNAHLRLLSKAWESQPAQAHEPFLQAPKGGLLTLSRLPIEQRAFTLFRTRDLLYTPALMDWLLHKGILHTEHHCAGVPVVVLNTHLNANYSGNWRKDNPFARTEWSQLQQLAELVRAQPANAIVAVAGDFNIPRGSWLYEEFLALSGLSDPLAADPRPTYRPLPGMPARYALALDYALVRAPALPGLTISGDLRLHERVQLVDGRHDYLSDHIAVELSVRWDDDAR